ncbi:MAG TPA: YitT family protein, partial [Spirochaetia bacterium]|nr:YitT family protein [Spirochaetia bacterium]
ALMGFGLGLVLLQNATTGGTDLAARLLDKALPWISIGKILLILDSLVVLYASIAFRSYELGLYAVVSIFIGTRVIDAVVEGVDYALAAFIISSYPNLIAQRLLSLPRGVTLLSGEGMYTGDRKDVLLCVVKKREIPRLKRIVKETDPNAFVIVTTVTEVLGEGFKSQ